LQGQENTDIYGIRKDGVEKKKFKIYQNEKARGGHRFVGTFMEVAIYQHPSAPSRLSDVCPFIHHVCTPLPLERFPLKWILQFSFYKKLLRTSTSG
jgi:hypothetical protein